MRHRESDYEEIYRFYINFPEYSQLDIAEHFKISGPTVTRILKMERLKERVLFIVPSLSQENTFYLFDEIVEKKFIVDNAKFVFPKTIFNSFEIEYLQKMGFKFKN